MNTISDLFKNRPDQWGLRGDPCLWEEMQLKTENMVLPENGSELEELLHTLFYELTGARVSSVEKIYVRRFADKAPGMSGGVVSCKFWLTKGFPLILRHYDSLKNRMG